MILGCGKNIATLIALCTLSLFTWSQDAKLSIPLNHSKAISHFVFSPDEKLFATASADQTIKIWDVNFGCLLFTINECDEAITEIAFSHDGTKLVSSSRDHSVMVLDISSGKVINNFKHKDVVFDVAFSHDDKLIVSASKDSTAIIWDTETGGKLWTLGPHKAWVMEVSFSLDDRFVTTTTYNKSIVWDVSNGTLVDSCNVHSETTAQLTPTTPEIIVEIENDSIQIQDVNTGKIKYSIFLNEDSEYEGSYYRSDNLLATIIENRIKLWDISTGILLSTIGEDLIRTSNAHFINDGKKIIFQEEDDVVVWDCSDASVKRYSNSSYLINEYDEYSQPIIVLNDLNRSQITILDSSLINQITLIRNVTSDRTAISPSGKLIAINSDDKIYVYDSKSGKQKAIFRLRKANRRGLKFNHDESLLAVYSENSINIWNLITGSKTCSIHELKKSIRALEFSPDNKTFSTISTMNNTAEIWSLESGTLFKTLKGHSHWAYSLDYSGDGSRLITSSRDGTIIEWNSNTGEILNHYKDHLNRVYAVKYCKEDSLLMSRSRDKTAKIWNASTGNILHSLEGHDAFLSGINDNSNGDKIITTSADGSIIQWDAKTGRQMMRFFVFNKDSNKTLLITEDNYYKSSKSTASILNYTKGLLVFPFSQFDLKYNRPDIILDRLGYASQETIKSYQRAYEKRLQKMGFTEDMLKADFHLPDAIITNIDELSVQIDQDEITLNVNTLDSKYPLDRINVWINNVPVYGVNGISLRLKMVQEYETEIQLQLNEGENKIEVSVLNQAGAESYKETVYINCTKPASKPNLYFVGIGVKDYENQDMNLKFSDKDIRDIANLYANNKTYGKIYIDTFLNESVTLDIIPQIRKRLESSSIHDQVIFMYSGHGILDDSLDYYLTTHDIDFLQPSTKGIPYEAVDELLDNIPARQKLVLIDACNSGEVDKDELVESKVLDNESGVTAELIAPKGDLFKKYKSKTNSFEMMQELFTDLRRGTGATVISSSSGKYFSFEDDEYQNGVYTYALKLGLKGEADANKDKEITVTELKEYLYRKVESLTNGKQKPTARQENLEYDFRVW